MIRLFSHTFPSPLHCLRVTCVCPTTASDGGLAFGTEDGNIEIMTLTDEFRSHRDLAPLIAKLTHDGDITHA